MPAVDRARTGRAQAVDGLAIEAAERLRNAFSSYADEFASVTRRAKWRFQTRDWKGRNEDALERLDLYERFLREAAGALDALLGARLTDEALWVSIKERFSGLIAGRHDAELAETFFNSITRTVFRTVGINRHIEFFRWVPQI